MAIWLLRLLQSSYLFKCWRSFSWRPTLMHTSEICPLNDNLLSFVTPSTLIFSLGTMAVLSHYSDVIMNATVSQITGVSIVCSTVCSVVDQRKHQSSASLAFVRGIYRWPADSPHKGWVTRKMFSFDDVIVNTNLQIIDIIRSREKTWFTFNACMDK